MRLTIKLLLIAIATALPLCVAAHGDLDIRIKQKSEEIKKDSLNPILYFERGKLYFQHSEYKNSISDYNTSIKLGLENSEVHYRKAQCFYKSSQFYKAKSSIETYLNKKTKSVNGYKLSALISKSLKQHKDALLSYEYVIDNAAELKPQDFINYSELVYLNTSSHLEAIKALEKGIIKLGKDTFSLQSKKLDYLLNTNNKEQIITQFDYFINLTNRKEFWYYKKAKFLFKSGDINNAKIEIENSKKAINKLPQRFKNMKSIIDLKNNIDQLEKAIQND